MWMYDLKWVIDVLIFEVVSTCVVSSLCGKGLM